MTQGLEDRVGRLPLFTHLTMSDEFVFKLTKRILKDCMEGRGGEGRGQGIIYLS